jgi:hypothetical protein
MVKEVAVLTVQQRKFCSGACSFKAALARAPPRFLQGGAGSSKAARLLHDRRSSSAWRNAASFVSGDGLLSLRRRPPSARFPSGEGLVRLDNDGPRSRLIVFFKKIIFGVGPLNPPTL